MPVTLEVSTADLMDFFACGRTTINTLTKMGILQQTRRGHYDLREASRAYSLHHRAIAAQHNPQDLKQAALSELVALRRSQRIRNEKAMEREEATTIDRAEHQKIVALVAFSFRAAMQDASDIIICRLRPDKEAQEFIEGVINGRLAHHTGQAANKMGMPETELQIMLAEIRSAFIEPPWGWIHPKDYPSSPPPEDEDPLCPRPAPMETTP